MSPEIIARMEARGWKWNPDSKRFRASGGKIPSGTGERTPIGGSIYFYGSGWYASYGTIGIGWGDDTNHPTPEAAADEAEAWFRQVVTGLPGVRV